MKIPTKELLINSHNAPGLMSKSEIVEVQEWFKFFNEHLNAYKEAFGEPTGFSVKFRIESMDFYRNR